MPDFSFFGQQPAYFDYAEALRKQKEAEALAALAAQQQQRPKLSLADLYQDTPVASYPDPPQHVQRYDDLGPDPNLVGPPTHAQVDLQAHASADARKQALLNIAAALGGNPGTMGANLAHAAQATEDWKGQQVDRFNADSDRQFQVKERQAEIDAKASDAHDKDAAAKIKAQGRLAAYQVIATAEPTWEQRAAAAAQEGRDQDLNEMQKQIGVRSYLRAQGMNPDDPNAQKVLELKQAADAEIARKEEEKKRGLIPGLDRYYPKSQDEAVAYEKQLAVNRAKAEAAYRKPDASASPDHIHWSGGQAYTMTKGPDGQPVAVPVQGVQGADRMQVIGTSGGEHFRVNVNTGEPMPVYSPQQLAGAVKETEQKIGRPLTVDEKAQARKQILSGASTDDTAARLKSAPPIVKPETAPTAGKPPGPPPVQKKAPPQQSAKAPPPKVQAVELAQLRAQVQQRYKTLPPDQVESKYQQALQIHRSQYGW